MYVVYIVDHIHHLLNEPKKSKFAYNSDRREYYFSILPFCQLKAQALNYQLLRSPINNKLFFFPHGEISMMEKKKSNPLV
jgi:hypothetical protein